MLLSATVEPLDSPALAGRLPRRDRLAAVTNGRLYLWLVAAALAVAALSLLIPSTPSYDPWAWLVWGREIAHGTLHTPGGPTWKPLPVLFTTLFAPFDRAQPDLWLAIARAGAVVAVLMTAKLAARATWSLRDDAATRAHALDRWSALAPSAVAAVVAAVGLALYGNLLSDSALGYSEGLAIAAILIAVERHIDGHRHQAFALGLVAALDRPEVWLFWGPYGLWLMWKDPGSRALVLGLAVLCLLLWFVPQKLGGGSFTSGVDRAHHPRSNSAAFAPCPFCAELVHHAWPLVLMRIKIAILLASGAAAVALARTWRQTGHMLPTRRERALLALVLAAAFGFGWWIVIALETQLGFSGNDRYLVIGCASLDLAAGIGFGWAGIALAGLVRRSRSRSQARLLPVAGALPTRAITLLGALAAAAVFALVPNWVGPSLDSLPKTHRALLYQAGLRTDLESLIAQHGGAAGLLHCGQGTVMASNFQVPMVAWNLGLRVLEVRDQPPTNHAGQPKPLRPWPSVIFQNRDTRSAGLLPHPKTILSWEQAGARYTVSAAGTMRLFEDCSEQSARS